MLYVIREMAQDWIGRVILFVLVIFLLMLPISIWAAIEGERKWQAFALTHDCIVVGRMSGDTFVGTGIGTNGQLTTTIGTTAAKTGYKCNDGVTYWR